jgi:rfaE bifunctional protein nucleotidyltransferase chain/domain/rfaE bifunctional protein kinase chain/domain
VTRRVARVVVVGDVLLDRDVTGTVERIAPDAPVPVLDVRAVRETPGGAGLTALLCGAEPGIELTVVAPLADDAAGRALWGLLVPAGRVVALPHEGATRRKSRLRAAGQTLLRVDDGGPGTPGPLPGTVLAEVAEVLAAADVVLVSDYGGGVTRDPAVRELLAAAAARRPVVWDPHPRGGVPVPGCAAVTPNLAEAGGAVGCAAGTPAEVVAALARQRWGARTVCLTAGERGAFLAAEGQAVSYLPAPRVEALDPCGAGDRFAATLAARLAGGDLLSEAAAAAVSAASQWVGAGGLSGYAAGAGATWADRPPATAPPSGESAAQVIARVRAAGGTVVATGGCFDVLHAGHVACLEAARRLGDALVVLLNSDASVRRLKGPGRPVSPAADRVRVLSALASVDAVVVFAEDDPRAALAQLRPDVWAKGGDYTGDDLPEATLVRGWGGRVVLLPYLAGRSTTGILAAGASPAAAPTVPPVPTPQA